ncbi:acyl-CoA thioesterase [Marmoricola sp. RAF53]|uniref:acyl-CoA thioesterase n=1 Tax=Marmoricola sp. RAF53 TaxID=3233059 RepID=UPI003F94B9B5
MAVTQSGPGVIRVSLRWRDLDALGHLYHATTVELLDEARCAWIAAHVAPEAGESHVVARLDITYLAEVTRVDRWLEVTTEVSRVGTTSLALTESVANPAGTVIARCEATIVFWDPVKRVSRPLTEAELRRIEEFEAQS